MPVRQAPGPAEAAVPAVRVAYDEQGRYASASDRQRDLDHAFDVIAARRADEAGLASGDQWRALRRHLGRDPQAGDVQAFFDNGGNVPSPAKPARARVVGRGAAAPVVGRPQPAPKPVSYGRVLTDEQRALEDRENERSHEQGKHAGRLAWAAEHPGPLGTVVAALENVRYRTLTTRDTREGQASDYLVGLVENDFRQSPWDGVGHML